MATTTPCTGGGSANDGTVPGPTLQVSGLIRSWPPGFENALPLDHWVVAHARPRQEKRLADDLERLGQPGCLFLERRRRHYPGKGVQESLVPLLGGYLFLHLGRQHDLEPIYRTGRVLRLIQVPAPALLAEELGALRRLVEATPLPLQVRPELVPGRMVEVRRGVFAGCQGIIRRRQGLTELVVNLDVLGHSVAVRMDAMGVESLHGA